MPVGQDTGDNVLLVDETKIVAPEIAVACVAKIVGSHPRLTEGVESGDWFGKDLGGVRREAKVRRQKKGKRAPEAMSGDPEGPPFARPLLQSIADIRVDRVERFAEAKMDQRRCGGWGSRKSSGRAPARRWRAEARSGCRVAQRRPGRLPEPLQTRYREIAL
jgi:hypothetical protein